MLIEHHLENRRPYGRALRFVSDRRPVTLDPGEILYVESNDDEVWIHTADGGAYRTKSRISQWEALLDRRFLCIHCSYIVNTERIEEVRSIRIGDRLIEISRKYKEEVRRRLGSEPSTESGRTQEQGIGPGERRADGTGSRRAVSGPGRMPGQTSRAVEEPFRGPGGLSRQYR